METATLPWCTHWQANPAKARHNRIFCIAPPPASTHPVPCCPTPSPLTPTHPHPPTHTHTHHPHPQVECDAFASLFLVHAGGRASPYGRLVGGLMRAAVHAREPQKHSHSTPAGGHAAVTAAACAADAAAEPGTAMPGRARQEGATLAPRSTNSPRQHGTTGATPNRPAGLKPGTLARHTHTSAGSAVRSAGGSGLQGSGATGTERCLAAREAQRASSQPGNPGSSGMPSSSPPGCAFPPAGGGELDLHNFPVGLATNQTCNGADRACMGGQKYSRM